MESQLKIGGTPASGAGFSTNGNGYSFPAVVLNDATGNEVAFQLDYTTNKASSGDDTGLVINQINTLSPGLSILADFQTNSGSVARIESSGNTYVKNLIAGDSLLTGTQGLYVFPAGSNSTLQLNTVNTFTVAGSIGVNIAGTHTASSGIQTELAIKPTYNQTATAGATDILVNRTETAVGSGPQLLIDLQVGSATRFNVDNKGLLNVAVTAGITADVGSIQGGSPLTTRVNEVSVCANAGDAVTLITAPAVGSIEQTIINNGANACDVFPASGDDIGAGADTAVSLAAGANITYVSYNNTNWFPKT